MYYWRPLTTAAGHTLLPINKGAWTTNRIDVTIDGSVPDFTALSSLYDKYKVCKAAVVFRCVGLNADRIGVTKAAGVLNTDWNYYPYRLHCWTDRDSQAPFPATPLEAFERPNSKSKGMLPGSKLIYTWKPNTLLKAWFTGTYDSFIPYYKYLPTSQVSTWYGMQYGIDSLNCDMATTTNALPPLDVRVFVLLGFRTRYKGKLRKYLKQL